MQKTVHPPADTRKTIKVSRANDKKIQFTYKYKFDKVWSDYKSSESKNPRLHMFRGKKSPDFMKDFLR